MSAEWDQRTALGVVLASGGYPASARKGDVISGLDHELPVGTKVFHAGTKYDGENIVTNGGRVVCVTSLGESVQAAQEHVYRAVDNITWEGVFFRKDIGYRAIKNK